MTNRGIEMRLARPEDTDEIARLLPSLAGPSFVDRFPGKTAADFCRWKYLANPFGDASVGVVLDRGRVVGLAAAVPKRIQVGHEIVTAVELGDFITDPEYRKRGFFSALIELVCREAAERGAAFAYVRPNSISFPILERSLGFYEAQKIDHRRYAVPSDVLHRKTGLPSGLVRLMGMDWLSRKNPSTFCPAQRRGEWPSRALVRMPMSFGRGRVRITRFRWYETAVISTGVMPIAPLRIPSGSPVALAKLPDTS